MSFVDLSDFLVKVMISFDSIEVFTNVSKYYANRSDGTRFFLSTDSNEAHLKMLVEVILKQQHLILNLWMLCNTYKTKYKYIETM